MGIAKPIAKPIAKIDSWKLFDRIASRYDFLNRVLSMGIDVYWRKRVARRVFEESSSKTLLDLATGTGDQLIFLLNKDHPFQSAVGMDLSEGMLNLGRRKIEEKGLSQLVKLETGDAMKIPAPDASFDTVTMSFGIRNVPEVDRALREIFRVLKPRGRVLILEFSIPGNTWFRKMYLFYLRKILPMVGGWISGDSFAYRYLNETIETFPYGEKFCTMLRAAGFSQATAEPLTFGIASIYIGDKKA